MAGTPISNARSQSTLPSAPWVMTAAEAVKITAASDVAVAVRVS